MKKIESLNESQLDALQETSNIGCSHAATAISQMINKTIDISVPNIEIIPLSELEPSLHTISQPHHEIVGVYLELTDDFQGSILYLFPIKSALILADLLFGQELGTTTQLDEMGQSAVTEVGNIVVSAYTNALGMLLNTTVMLSPPKFEQGIPQQLVQEIIKTAGKDITHALVFNVQITGDKNTFTSYFLLIPSPQSLDKLLQSLVSCLNSHDDSETQAYVASLSLNTEN